MKYVKSLVVLVVIAALMMACCRGSSRPSYPMVVLPHVETNIIIDPTFDPDHKDAVYEALLHWTSSTRGLVTWKVTNHPTAKNIAWTGPGCNPLYMVIPTTSTSELQQKLEKEHSEQVLERQKKTSKREPWDNGVPLAYTISDCRLNTTILVIDRIEGAARSAKKSTRDMLVQVMVHEIGHYFHLDHTPIEHGSAMFPTVDLATACLTKADLDKFCTVNGCDSSTMSGCP